MDDALYAAAIAGDADAMSKLAIQVEETSFILHTESWNGYAERVRFILRNFASEKILLRLDTKTQTALHYAAYYRKPPVVEVLIDEARKALSTSSFQAFLRQANRDLDTALSHAVARRYIHIVKMLVDADPSDTHIQNSQGKTPMYIAAEKGYIHILMMICTACTAPSVAGPDGTTALHALISNLDKGTDYIDVIRMIIAAAKRASNTQVSFEAFFDTTDASGSTVLQLAVSKNYVDVVELLLQEDPVYQRGGKKNQLVNMIFPLVRDEDYEAIVKLLSNAYQVGIGPQHEGVIASILSIQTRENAKFMCQLEENKQVVTFVDDEGWSLLHYAALYQFDEILDVIINAQNDIGCQYMYENMTFTPFHIAVENGFTSTLTQLMKLWPTSSSACTFTNKFGQNILHIAATKSEEKIIEAILIYCAETYKEKIMNEPDVHGDTAFHLLVLNGCSIPEFISYKDLHNMEDKTPTNVLEEDNIVTVEITTEEI